MKANEIREKIDYDDIKSIVYWRKYFTSDKLEEYYNKYLDGEITLEEHEEILDLYDYLNYRLAIEYMKITETKN